MSSTIFLIIALVTTGIFVIQFILSIFFGDIDADVDVDTDISSVVSFKGLTHFGIGFGWYMYLAGNTEIQTYAVAIFVGLCFVLAVWFLYKKAFQLQQVNRSEQTEQLVGRECTIYFKQNDGRKDSFAGWTPIIFRSLFFSLRYFPIPTIEPPVPARTTR